QNDIKHKQINNNNNQYPGRRTVPMKTRHIITINRLVHHSNRISAKLLLLSNILVLQRLTLRPTLDLSTNVLDRGHGYSNSFDSAEVVLFTHSRRISVVTKD